MATSSKLLSVTLAVTVLLIVAIISTVYASEYEEKELRRMWISFMRKYERFYGVQESEQRFEIFKNNVLKVKQMNRDIQDDVYGVTKFMDMTEEEFSRNYLWSRPVSAEDISRSNDDFVEVIHEVKVGDAPAAFDWREHGAVTGVKSQGSCGSCWAFSTTGNLESIVQRKVGRLVPLSEQQLVDCDHECDPDEPRACDAGCQGGLMLNALTYIKKHGIMTEDRYKYEAHAGQCRYNATAVAVRIDGAVKLPENEEQIKQYLYEKGALAVALNASWLQFYFGGISNPLTCDPKKLSHGVTLVGYGRGKTKLGKEMDYWLLKNSWGAHWGEKGYFRMARGTGKCGINTYVVSAIIN